MALRKTKKEIDETRENPKNVEELDVGNDTAPVDELEEDNIVINDLPDVEDVEKPMRSGEYTVVSRFSILFGATYKMFFEGDTIKEGQNISKKELERLVRNGYIK